MWLHAVGVADAACNGKTQIRLACPCRQNAVPTTLGPCRSSIGCSPYSAAGLHSSIWSTSGTKSLWCRSGTDTAAAICIMGSGNKADSRRSRSPFGTVLYFGSIRQVAVSPKVPSHHPGNSRYSGRCLSGRVSPARCRTVDSSSRYRVQSRNCPGVVFFRLGCVCGSARRRCIGNKSITPSFLPNN